MDLPAPFIFLVILLVIPFQICFSPKRTSDMDYYWKETIENIKFYYEKFFGKFIKTENVNEKLSDGFFKIDKENIDSKDAEDKGYFGCEFLFFVQFLEKMGEKFYDFMDLTAL